MGHVQTVRGYYAAIDKCHRIYHRRLCLIPEGEVIPGHPCIAENRIVEFDGFLDVSDMINFFKKNPPEPETVAFDDIWHQTYRENDKEFVQETDDRYKTADVTFPGIISAIRNPDNKPFRMVDGRRRMWKQQEAGGSEGLFYVIPEPEIYRYFWMIVPMAAFQNELNRINKLQKA